MIDCTNAEIRDALPDLMHGRLSELDRITMTAHVESCADCRSELSLLEQVRASAPLAPRMDVAGIVRALPAASPSGGDVLAAATSRSRVRGSILWKLAAGAALLITGTLTFANGRHQADPVNAVAVAPPSIIGGGSLAAVVAPTVAPSASSAGVAVSDPAVSITKPLPPERKVATLSLTGGVKDLSNAQIHALLKDLDNVQGIPAADPEPVTISVDDNEGLQ